WEKLTTAEVAKYLDDARPVVREKAIGRLAKMEQSAVAVLGEVLVKGSSNVVRRNALWALTRIDGDAARAQVRKALSDKDEGVRQVAANSASLHRDAAALGRLVELLRDSSPAVRREAATGLGRIGRPQVVPAILTALR